MKVGRPITKPNRVKIGLSASQEASFMFNEIARVSGKSKSRIFEEAIKYFKSREDIIYQRMQEYQELGDKCLLTHNELDDILKSKQ